MRTVMKFTQVLLDRIVNDLRRPHEFAYERVGFITCRYGRAASGTLLILAHAYHPVADENYIDDPGFGALIDGNALRNALQLALTFPVGLFHVHLHDFKGTPRPSKIDEVETDRFVPDFVNIRPSVPHGAVILSADSISGNVWTSRYRGPKSIAKFQIVGTNVRTIGGRR